MKMNYRDIKKLDKKYKQIESRIVWSKLKNKIWKIRNYKKLIRKKENSTRESSNANTFNSMITKNMNNKNIIRIKKLEYENNSNNFNIYILLLDKNIK